MDFRISYDPASLPLAFAARELESYLSRMLPEGGGVLTLRLEAGTEEGPPERWSVSMTPEGGVLSGSCPRAVVLGVYDYLRRLGCRFLGPGERWERVPAISPSALAVRYTKAASFRHRGVCIEGADSLENILDFIDWLPKVGYNSFFLQFKSPYAFLARWYRHERNPLREPEPFTPADAQALLGTMERAVKERGLLLHQVGHGWTGECLGYPSLSWEADGRPLTEEKRPLAAEIGGVRDLWKGVPADTNLCYHSAQAVDVFASLVVEHARRHPAADYLHVWLADEYNNVCECPECQKTTLSDQYVDVLNEIDRRLSLEGLGTRLVFLLYQELLWPPRRARLLHPERFVLMFAPISRTFGASYRVEERLPPIPDYTRNQITLPTNLEENLAFLRGWQGCFQGDSFLYDYPLGRAHYGDLGYLHMARVIGGDVKSLRKLGLDGYISCQELRAGMPNFLPNYVMGRLLLEETADVEDLVEEYFQAAYGGGAGDARAYLSALSRLECCDYVNGKGERVNPQIARNMEKLQQACRDFAPVLEAHSGEGPFWTVLAHHRAYALALARALERLAQGRKAESREAWQALRRLICTQEEAYQPCLDVFRVLEVMEKYTGFPTQAGREGAS